jgi:uncharacterized membrane protein (UPF0127 family)
MPNRLVYLALGIVVSLGAANAPASAAAAAPVVASCANPRLPPELVEGTIATPASPLPIVTGITSKVKLRLAVAASEQNRMVGLMCVLKLRPSEGMIFVFPRDDEWDFWMKNTLTPLDMIWLDADGTITTVAANVPSSTLATPDAAVARRNGHGRFVIELRAGEAARAKLAVGTRLQLPPLQVESP